MNSVFKNQYPEYRVFEKSLRKYEDKYYFAAEKEGKVYLVIGNSSFNFFEKEKAVEIIKKTFPFLCPTTAGGKTSFGFGDRTGYATIGHIRANKTGKFFPVFAQQSARELERTGRNFQQVLDDAIFWCFVEGWSDGFGADADHAKSFDILEKAISAGYTFFTIDPSDKIKGKDAQDPKNIDNLSFYLKEYSGRKFSVDSFSFVFTDDIIVDLAFTYGKALDFIEQCFLFISEKKENFDFEVSVDETKISTTPSAHVFIVMELIRRKINFQSLALRFPGRFEKGIDYIGDIDQFARELEIHNSIRNSLGPYKLSLHSGSDKFSIYKKFKEIAGDKFHIKTSGTSWIQAMKTIAAVDRDLFFDCMYLAMKQFEKNAASYEISADKSRINPERIRNENIEDLFSNNDIRQLIHISYGSIIGSENLQIRERFYAAIEKNLELYTQFVEEHLKRHIELLS